MTAWLVAMAAIVVACTPRDTSVTLAPVATSTATSASAPRAVTSCPRSFSEAAGAACEAPGDLGAACTYPEGRCECVHSLHCARGGVMRTEPPPREPDQILACTTRACEGVVASAACATEGATCRGPVSTCNAFYACNGGRWALVQAGPPP